MVAGRLKPRFCAMSAKAWPNWSLVAWKRHTRSLVSWVEIAGAPDVFISIRLAASVSGITAKVTPDAQVPRIAWTLLTSISFLAASTPCCGEVWSSSASTSSLRPAAPPASLTVSAANRIAFCMPEPYGLPAPVIGLSAPIRNGSACASAARPGSASTRPAAPPRASNCRREILLRSTIARPRFSACRRLRVRWRPVNLRSGGRAPKNRFLQDRVDATIAVDDLGHAEIDRHGHQRDRFVLGQLARRRQEVAHLAKGS